MLYHIKLKDDQVLRQHWDQLQLCLADPEDNGPGEHSEPGTIGQEQTDRQDCVTDPQAQPSAPGKDTRDSPKPKS